MRVSTVMRVQPVYSTVQCVLYTCQNLCEFIGYIDYWRFMHCCKNLQWYCYNFPQVDPRFLGYIFNILFSVPRPHKMCYYKGQRLGQAWPRLQESPFAESLASILLQPRWATAYRSLPLLRASHPSSYSQGEGLSAFNLSSVAKFTVWLSTTSYKKVIKGQCH